MNSQITLHLIPNLIFRFLRSVNKILK